MTITAERTAQHRPALRPRTFRHDAYTALDLFSGFGGLTQGVQGSGFDVIYAANHNEYKVEVHEANHPETQHLIADLVDTNAKAYADVRDLPAATLLTAGVSCVNHSQANTQRAYEQGLTLFNMDDDEYDSKVTKSEKDRATANCVLHYAQRHHPALILVECTTELTSWGPAADGKKKVGDGSTYRWWLKQFDLLGYDHKALYLNSMFFGVGQSRDRFYLAMWDRKLPAPDLDHRPETWCGNCSATVQARWTWKTGIPATGRVAYGKQYDYRCPGCHREVVPPFTPSLAALDLTTLGTRIGDMPLKNIKDKATGEVYQAPMARSTMLRAERCRQRFAEFPAVVMPAKAERGAERHPWQPLATQTSQQEAALLSASPVGVVNFQGGPRGVLDPLPTQVGSETLGLLAGGVFPFRKNTLPAMHGEPMPTVTSEQVPGLLFSGWFKQNGSTGNETAPHPLTDPLGTLTARDTTALMYAEWQRSLQDLLLEDCYFRMMSPAEVGRGCGFDVGNAGTFKVWGSNRDQVDGFGNAVSPPVGQWISSRLRAALHSERDAAILS